jgi:hypothetical protein
MLRTRMRLCAAVVGTVSLATSLSALAAPQYKLAYWFEVGGYQNANGCQGCSCTGTGNHSLYVHVVDADGTKLGGIRVEDADYPGFFGITNSDPNDKFGFCEIPIPANNSPRATVNDAGRFSDTTVEMIEQRMPTWGHYSWECAFMRVPDGISVTFDSSLLGTPNIGSSDGNAGCILNAPFTKSCAYYDIDPMIWASDAFQLDSSSSSYGQTFVANGNRVVIAKFQTTVGFGQKLRYAVRIRENGPGGAIRGPAALSRVVTSDEYYPQLVNWPVLGSDAVEVVPGHTYYAEVYRADTGGDINLYRRNNVYPNGQMYRGGAAVSGSDLVGRVICATVEADPKIQLNTSVLTPAAVLCSVPPDQSFTVTNSGATTLNYTLTVDQPWVRVEPGQGALSSGQSQIISVRYHVQGLAAGLHHAQITVSDPAASNSPQQITVSLNVISPRTPGDLDNDCDVDQDDFGQFQACYSGSGIEQTNPACADARLDADIDVDLDDFALFRGCMSGSNAPTNPNCAD